MNDPRKEKPCFAVRKGIARSKPKIGWLPLCRRKWRSTSTHQSQILFHRRLNRP